jgi:solute:Na+ symporter, SSS family
MDSIFYKLSLIDIVAFLAILVITGLAVLWGQTRKKIPNSSSPIELLLMGRRLTLPFFVCSLMATWYGGIFGVTSLTFERGIFNFVTQGFFWYLTYLIFAFFLVSRIRNHEATGLADLAHRLFGPKAGKLTSLLAFANLLPIGYVAGLGHFLAPFLGVDWWVASFFGLCALYSYALWGGLRAIVFSDVVQSIVMVISVWMIVYFSWAQYGGLSFLQENLPASHFDPTGGNDWGSLFIWGAIALGTLVDPNFHQRVQATKDAKTARKGILIATCIWILFDLATTLGGLYARAILPEASSQQSYLLLGISILPDGLRGVFLAGILATILSTLDSYLFTAGSSLSFDFFGLKEKKHIKLGMIFCGLLAWMIAPVFSGNIVYVWRTIGGMISACLLPALLFGLWRPFRLDEKGFLTSVISGIVIMALYGISKQFLSMSLDEFYLGLLASISGLIFSLMRRTPIVS